MERRKLENDIKWTYNAEQAQKELMALWRKHRGDLPVYSFGHAVIYWVEEEAGDTIALCGTCMTRYAHENKGGDWKVIAMESGSDYEECILCENCSKQLASYYEEETGRE